MIPPPPRAKRADAFAIVLVLGFVVLLTVVILAFFSNALSGRQIANSSANQARASLFAQGCLEIVTGDLRQEIAAGSNAATVGAGARQTKLYFPQSARQAVPEPSGSSVNDTPNLIKRSAYGVPFFTGGPARAAASSTTAPSRSGRAYSLSRWNKALLLPKADPASATDFTPVANFSAPDWILVARDGSNPQAPSDDVVGRFAFAIYNEGGILDVNASGYPTNVAATTAAYKNALAYADLTKIGLAPAEIDTLLAWRCRATLQQPGGFAQAVAGNTDGFLTTFNTALRGGQSDRMFSSRQQLIDFFQKTLGGGASVQNALQYLGTFNRSLNQPSYVPDATRPRITGYSAAPSPGSAVFGNNAGGNDGYSLDDQINPSFLTARVNTTFMRNDGSVAEVGEPLVKSRFPLQRLAWITDRGPSALLPDSDVLVQNLQAAGISKQLLEQGTAENIYNNFGLTWNATTRLWNYDHAIPGGSVGKLSDVQTANREPDFFEILKAGITAGSLAKGAATNHDGRNPSYPNAVDVNQYNLDTSINFHIIQIASNIVDQFDPDGYPTRLTYAGRTFHGIENLPYLYRVRNIGVNVGGNRGLMLLLPEVWNPHDPASSSGSPGPTDFRFVLAGPNVGAIGRTRVYEASGSQGTPASSSTSSMPIYSLDSTTPADAAVTELAFSIAETSDAREPVFLGGLKGSAQSTSINLTPGASHQVRGTGYADSDGFVRDTVSGLRYCGVLLGQFPTTWSSPSGTVYPLVVPPNHPHNPSSADACVLYSVVMADYILQYRDTGGRWTTYQSNYSTLPRVASVSVSKRSGASSGAFHVDISRSSGDPDTGEWHTFMDPRTSRFGASSNSFARLSNPVTMSADYYGKSNRPGTTFGQGTAFGVPGSGLQTDPTGSSSANRIGWYPGSWNANIANGSRMFVPAYYAENVISARPAPQSNSNYYTDPDGVVRRGMAGLSSLNSTVGEPMAALTTSTSQGQSRPYLLNRPFRSVAELGYVFSGIPWRNLDFSNPESGFSPLLDLFCISETFTPASLTSGKIDLNTRQSKVIRAVLAGANDQGNAYKDDSNPSGGEITCALSTAEIDAIAQALVARTTGTAAGQGPLRNVSELVGSWRAGTSISGALAPHNIDGAQSYSGFSGDLSSAYTDPSTLAVARLRESAVRALAESGQTRVWNLMIDLVGQVGRYRTGESSLDQFIVEGEQRYWLHLAIDRLTGQVLSEQLELVKE